MKKTKCKKRGNDTLFWNENRKSLKAPHLLSPGFGNLNKFDESSPSELTEHVASGVSESLVSIASFVRDELIYECTGVFIEDSCADATSILTAAHTVGTPDIALTDDLTAWIGGPLVDFEGNFVGINCRRRGEKTAFLPKNKILERLGPLRDDAVHSVDDAVFARWPDSLCFPFNLDPVLEKPDINLLSKFDIV